MRLSISRIIPTEVNIICRSRRLRRITLTEFWIILDIMYKPSPIIVLLYIQSSDRCNKRFAVKRLVRLTFQTAAGHFCCFVIFAALKWWRHQRPIIFLNSAVEQFAIFGGKMSRQWRNGLWSRLEQLLRAPDLYGPPDESVKTIEDYSLEIVYTKSINTGVTGALERKSPKSSQ